MYLIIKIRTNVLNIKAKGALAMTENEMELIHIIRTSDDPKGALDVALKLIALFLEKREEPQDTFSEHLPESA